MSRRASGGGGGGGVGGGGGGGIRPGRSGFSSPLRPQRPAPSGIPSPMPGPRAAQSGFSSPVRVGLRTSAQSSPPSQPQRGYRNEQWPCRDGDAPSPHPPRRCPSRSPRRMGHGSGHFGRLDHVRPHCEESGGHRKRLRSGDPSPPPVPIAIAPYRKDSLMAPPNNRDDPSRIVIPPPAFTSNVSNVPVADGSASGSALDGYGALVSRSLHLGDGTVRTYFSLPTDMGLPPTAVDALNPPGYPEVIPDYSRGIRPASSFGRELKDQWRSGRFGIAASVHDTGFIHDKSDGGNLFSTSSDPNPFTNDVSELRSTKAGFDLPSQRYGAEVMHKEELASTTASRSPFQDPDPKSYSSTYRNASDDCRPTFPPQKGDKGFIDLPVHHSRERPLTPMGLGCARRVSHHGDDQTTYKRLPQPLPYNISYNDYHRPSSATYPRDVAMNITSRDGNIGPQRDYGLSSYMEGSMAGTAKAGTIRSPQWGETRSDSYPSKRGPLDRHIMERKLHKQGRGVSPWMGGGYHLDFDSFNGREDVKRRHMGSSKVTVENGHHNYEPDFKSRVSQCRDTIGRRTPEMAHGFGRREDMNHAFNIEFERRRYVQRSRSPIGPPHNRERSPLRPRKGIYYDERSPLRPRKGAYCDDNVRDLSYSDHYYGKKYEFHEGPQRLKKFSGPLTEREERTWHERDMRDNFPGNQEQVVAAVDLPEDSREFKQQVFRSYLRFSKVLNENLEEKKRYVEQGKSGTLFCLVCSRLSKPFLDTHGLVMHAYNSKKKGLRAEHVGFHKAICTLMGWSSIKEPDNKKTYHDISLEEAQASKDDLIIWPPAIIIHDVYASMKSDKQSDDNGNLELNELLQELGQANGKVKVVSGRKGHPSTLVVKYLATFSGLQEAERLHRHFETCGHGRKNWLDNIESKLNIQQEGSDTSIDEQGKEGDSLYGYLALSEDMDKVDVETRRRCVVRSRKEIDSIAEDPLTVEQAQVISN